MRIKTEIKICNFGFKPKLTRNKTYYYITIVDCYTIII